MELPSLNYFNKRFINHELNIKSNEVMVDYSNNDGAIELNDSTFSYELNFSWAGNDLSDLIKTYRQIALQPEVDFAIEDIVNEAINSDSEESPIKIDLSDIELSDKIKDYIHNSFDKIIVLLDFKNQSHQHFREWYIDGRSYYQIVVNKNLLKNGIYKINKLDSAKMKKVREIKRDPQSQQIENIDEYFVFDNTLNTQNKNQNIQQFSKPLKLPINSVAYIHSGVKDPETGYILSHLHKAIKPANQLNMLEDSAVVYRVVRAPERRVYYVDTGNLQKTKAEEYMKGLIASHKNKNVYDAKTGEMRDKRHHQTMMEDLWLPRKNGSRGTEVSTLQGGQQLGEINDLEYFMRKLYKSLNVPQSRLDSSGSINFGRNAEITRDELKFNKFVGRARVQFNSLFLQLLKADLVLKRIVTEKEFKKYISNNIRFIYSQDFYINEMKESELLRERVELFNDIKPLIGVYYSNEQVRRDILKQTDETIKEIDKAISNESKDPRYKDQDNQEDSF